MRIGKHMVDFRGGSRHGTTEVLPGDGPLAEFVSPVITFREISFREAEVTNMAPLHVEVYKPSIETYPGHWQYVYYGLRCPHETSSTPNE